ncbi:hypothetical protein ACFW04_014355 [Cataglyphis niger]
MQIFKEANLHYDLNDADGSIKFCKRLNALIIAMKSRTPKNSLRLDTKFIIVDKCGFEYLMTSRLNQDNLEVYLSFL